MQLNVHVHFAVYPLESFILLQGGSWPDLQSRGGGVWPDSGEEAAGDEGQVGKGLEEVEPHLLVALARGEVV